MDPMDFEEYLWANGLDVYAQEIRRCRDDLIPLPDPVHAKCSRLFSEYMLVGGMPQVVEAFVEDADFRRPDKIKRQIIDLFSMTSQASFHAQARGSNSPTLTVVIDSSSSSRP